MGNNAMRLIETETDVAEGAAWLAKTEPRFAAVLPVLAPLPLRRRSDGFAALLQAIVGQQVSTAAAAAIWERIEAAGLDSEMGVCAAHDEALRAVGLSRPKIRYARALAEARIDYAALREVDDDEVIATLTAVPGIGAWTAQIYAMFALGRADVFAPADLALQEAARQLFDLADRPTPKALSTMAEPWSPWRAVAARLLFAYYRHIKQREGIL